MMLARASDDPALKQYYEELALKFAEHAANEYDPDNAAQLPIKSDGGSVNPQRRH